MNIVVIGAGAMGASYGGLLASTGESVRLVDTWPEHVHSIQHHGLRLTGVRGDHRIDVSAVTQCPDAAWADLAIVFVDSNATDAAARTAAEARGRRPAGAGRRGHHGQDLGQVRSQRLHQRDLRHDGTAPG